MTFMTYHEIIKIAIGSIKKKKSQTRRNNEGIEIAKWSWKRTLLARPNGARKHLDHKFRQY